MIDAFPRTELERSLGPGAGEPPHRLAADGVVAAVPFLIPPANLVSWARGGAAVVGSVAFAVAAGPSHAATLVVATGDNLTLLDADSGAHQRVVSVDLSTRAVAVSADGRFAFVVGGDSLVKADVITGMVVQRLDLPTKPRSVALTDDGASVLVGRPGAIDVLASDTFRRLGRIAIGERDAVSLRVRGNRAVSIDSGGRMRVLDIGARRVLSRPRFRRVGGAAFTPSGRHVRVVVGAPRPVLRTLSAATGRVTTAPPRSTGGATGGLALSCDGRHAYIAPGRTGRDLVAVDLRSQRILGRVRTIAGPSTPVLGAGRLYLAGGPIFTNFVPTYRARPALTRAPTFFLGEGEKPYGLAVTPAPCGTR